MTAPALSDTRLRTRNPRLQKDHRHHKRVVLELRGRFLTENSEEHELVTTNLSCGGAIVRAKTVPAVDTHVVCYIEEIGRVAGRVTRHIENGFAIAFQTSQPKRDRLADKLTWLYNKDQLGLAEDRGAPRFSADGPAVVVRQDGRRLNCRVIDISLTGAGFETDGPPPMVGEIVTTGNLSGEVMRRSNKAFGIRFLRPASVVEAAKAALIQ